MAKRARHHSGGTDGKRVPGSPPPGNGLTVFQAPRGGPLAGAMAPAAPAAEAVAAFERAMQAVQRHDYKRGAAAFQQLIEAFPAERALLDRARVYVELCRRELQAPPPATLEERMTAATAAFNDDDDEKAEELARGVLSEDPAHDLALYLLAAVEARRGQTDRALNLLAQAIAISPEAGAQARFDPDFEALRDNTMFRRLTDSHADSASPDRTS